MTNEQEAQDVPETQTETKEGKNVAQPQNTPATGPTSTKETPQSWKPYHGKKPKTE